MPPHEVDDATVPPPDASTDERKPAIGATEAVRVIGADGSASVLARSDTGATRTSVDTSLAADVGAGPITDATRVKSAARKSGTARPVVDVVVEVDGNPHVVAASVTDRGHMDYPLLLGRDVLGYYHVDSRRRADADEA